MALKKVALKIKSIKGSIPFPPAVSGQWKPLLPDIAVGIPHPFWKQGGKPLLKQGLQMFLFQGQGPPPPAPPVIGLEVVVLMPKKTVLKNGGTDVLVEGDKKDGIFGNKLKAIDGGNSVLKTGV